MDREILFRGKRVDNGEWIEGFYHNVYTLQSHSSDRKVTHHHIYTQDFDVIVNGNTIGQFTGLTDKNGNKIFEGDIIKCNICGMLLEEYQNRFGVVIYEESSFVVDFCKPYWKIPKAGFCSIDCAEVIGNIYDNPKLLEGNE